MDYSTALTLFFDYLSMDSDRGGAHDYQSFFRAAVEEFVEHPDKEHAFEVYRMFCDCYRVKLRGNVSFIDLLDVLKSYEENAATLLDKQRDHYVHSVNVFLLGLCIYAAAPRYQMSFQMGGYARMEYPGKKTTPEEEFLFQWGLAALFHDIGYPVEITSGQIKKFIRLVADVDGKDDPKPFVGYGDFSALNSVAEVLYPEDFAAPFRAESGEAGACLDPSKPLDLLAWDISRTLDTDPAQVKDALDGCLPSMQKGGYVDHGYYSAIILLKWYGSLAQRGGMGTELLFGPVLSAAGAILLHNWYKNGLQKPPFSLGPLPPDKHPLAYLLILCDELQEWNREAYGVLDRQRVLAADCRLDFTADAMDVHYTTSEGLLAPDFGPKKEALFAQLLDVKAVFPQGIRVTCTTSDELYADRIRRRDGALVPRPLLENLEKLARRIHENYNKAQLERHPDKPLEYPDWDSLTASLKYSNIRQARVMFDKLTACGYVAAPAGAPGEIDGFTPEQVEALARDEHDSWVAERQESGWQYAPVKDAEKKLSPYLIPYDQLTEEVKELDRDAVRNVFPLLHEIGLGVYRAEN